MANRHTHKKLRSLVRRRMAETGERYQTALKTLLAEEAALGRRGSVESGSVDLVAARYFGCPVTLAVFEAAEPVGRPIILRMPSSRDGAVRVSMPVPLFNVRRRGWQ